MPGRILTRIFQGTLNEIGEEPELYENCLGFMSIETLRIYGKEGTVRYVECLKKLFENSLENIREEKFRQEFTVNLLVKFREIILSPDEISGGIF